MMKRLGIALAGIVTVILSGCATTEHGEPRRLSNTEVTVFCLPPSASERILKSQSHFTGFTDVSEVEFVRRNDGDFLAASVSISKIGGFESIGHWTYVLRKDRNAPDWSGATLYHFTGRPDRYISTHDLLRLSREDMQLYITEHEQLMRELQEKAKLQQSAPPLPRAPQTGHSEGAR